MLTDLLFVYGTLKRGGRNHGLLSTAEFLGEAKTESRFRLIDCGDYPAMLEHLAAPLEIEGELYRIVEALLPTLDRLEDEGTLYRRVAVAVLPLEGSAPRPTTAWTYLWLGRTERFPLVPGSVWNVR
ncbi:MAG: gamma-glutamylcyclotransferase [Planctomycetia bacterium]|nr:gamma-glutamylcyclotransferase [Planctomycetia bacterium]